MQTGYVMYSTDLKLGCTVYSTPRAHFQAKQRSSISISISISSILLTIILLGRSIMLPLLIDGFVPPPPLHTPQSSAASSSSSSSLCLPHTLYELNSSSCFSLLLSIICLCIQYTLYFAFSLLSCPYLVLTPISISQFLLLSFCCNFLRQNYKTPDVQITYAT